MFRTDDGTLISNNEFADIGLFDSKQRVQEGTEYILPFTEYESDNGTPVQPQPCLRSEYHPFSFLEPGGRSLFAFQNHLKTEKAAPQDCFLYGNINFFKGLYF